jgi:fucose permease
LRVRIPRAAPQPVEQAAERLPLGYWLAWTSTSLTGSIEVCLGLWAVEVLRVRDHMSAGAAASAVSVILLGMFLGRLAGGRLALRFPAVALLLSAFAVSLFGFLIFWMATAGLFAVLGLFICGLGNAMHFPLALGLALRAAGPALADQAAARASYGMAISFGLAPFALGAIADRVGAHTAFLLVPVFLLAAVVVATRLRRELLTRDPVPVPAVAG